MRKEKREGRSGNAAEQEGANGSLWSCFSCPGTDSVLRILPMSSLGFRDEFQTALSRNPMRATQEFSIFL